MEEMSLQNLFQRLVVRPKPQRPSLSFDRKIHVVYDIDGCFYY
jgi:hypothetical protein